VLNIYASRFIVLVDEVDVEGYETGVGTNFINKGNPAKADAHLVALLRAKGAIIFGKSTMHEIGNQPCYVYYACND